MIIMKMEIVEELSGSNDQIIVKGKRTKRPRHSYSATSSGRDGGGGGEIWSTVSSPTTSSGISTTNTDQEDEDMANCLILLAHGGFHPVETPPSEKLGRRKLPAMASPANGSKLGIFVYECKTCNRTFPSFQALGGHRASHKKLKSAVESDRKKPTPAEDDREEEEEEERRFAGVNHVTGPPHSSDSAHKSLQIGNRPRIHECSICGSEFASGQALGGHMRRHRSSANPSPSPPRPRDGDEKPRKNVLALDLNLPAPPEDDHRDANLSQFPGNRQPRLVFSAAALVDCHY